jgi:arginine-tRNA-protein transferase
VSHHEPITAALPPPVAIPLTVLAEEDCPYLPGRRARTRAFLADQFPAELYHDFMDAGFRRSGNVIYQPVCRDCRLCVPIRVPVDRFTPSKSQRRCRRRNIDLRSTVEEPKVTDEKYELYRRYVAARHAGRAQGDLESFESFLYESPVETAEVCHRDADGRLLAVGICDVSKRSLSSVYFYFEPAEAKRGIGIFGALYEIELALGMEIPHYYLGYWVHGCGAMEYKATFRPCEVLGPNGKWHGMK